MTNDEAKDLGPGVPEALPRVVQRVVHAYPVERIDRLWLFPPLIRGRKESGLVAAGCHVPGAPAERRLLVTGSYTAERSGRGLDLEVHLEEEGEAPADRLPRVMQGVVVRSGIQLGEATEIEVARSPDALAAWFDDIDEDLLDPGLPPRAVQEELAMDGPDESDADGKETPAADGQQRTAVNAQETPP